MTDNPPLKAPARKPAVPKTLKKAAGAGLAAALGPSPSAEAAMKDMLMPGEKILRVARISPGIYWKGIVVFAFAVIVMLKAFMLGAFFMFVSLLMLSTAYLTKYFLVLAATDKRIMIRHGIINLDTVQFRYNKVESVELARTIVGQIMGYASVVITGTGSRIMVVPFVADANAFRAAINQILFDLDERESGTAAKPADASKDG